MPASSEVSLLFEAVLPPELLQKHRFTPEQARTDEFSYIPDPQLLLDQPLAPLPLAKVVSQAAQQQHRPIRLCFVGMLKMDGQKTIWLQQMRMLDRRRFLPRYVSFSEPDSLPDKGSAMAAKLVQLLVPVTIVPLGVSNEELERDPSLYAQVMQAISRVAASLA